MKVTVLQPAYSMNEKDMQKCFDGVIELLDKCDETSDIIVLPEYSDVPANVSGSEQFYAAIEKNNAILKEKAAYTAKRCNSILFFNAAYDSGSGYINTTYALNRLGELVGKYFKAHPAPSEVRPASDGGYGLDVKYSYEFSEPYVLELEGIRFGFMTCYDFYFYENFARLARKDIDVIIGCSYQRTDTHSALSIINKFLCYNTNAYLIRASISLGADSEVCGCSSVITPDGTELVNMKNDVGLASCEIDPHQKYYKAAGFNGKPTAHYQYIEQGRRPWLYRNAGASVVMNDNDMPYPRLCAHRGFSTAAPENTMPAWGAAVALGAKEIEFDLWSTSDGVIVSCHDMYLDRVSNGKGIIYEHTYKELSELDFGVEFGKSFSGLKISTFEEILRKFAGRVIMNIHVKIWDCNLPDERIEDIVSLIRKYDCEKHVYFMTVNDEVIRKLRIYAPDINVCVGHDDKRPYAIVDRAIELGAQKVQLFKPYFNQEMVDKAHEHGIICNVFFADDIEEAKRYREMGIDVILTNDYLKISNALGIS
ncbi:MAG: hypothetical protein IJZ03_01565 [Clostridia bacterium]|nr:hypothetical protein [Clostridia bacterium]